MKKITLILTLLIFTAGIVYGEALNEGFEGTFPPLGWTNDGWQLSTYGDPHTGDEFAYSNLSDATLTTLQVNASSSQNLTFWYRCESASYPQDLDVMVGDDIIHQIVGYASTTYTQADVSLADYDGQTIQIKFVGKTGTGGYSYGICLDDVAGPEYIPPPPTPTTILAPADSSSNVPTLGTLSWNDLGASYHFSFGTDNPPTNIEDSTDLGTATSYPYDGLDPNTTYYWKVVPYNESGTATGCEVWEFETGNSSLEITFTDGFEQDSLDNWFVQGNIVTTDEEVHTDTVAAKFDLATQDEASMTVSLDGSTIFEDQEPMLKFWYYANSSYSNSLTLDVYNPNDGVWQNDVWEADITYSTADQWVEAIINLKDYVPEGDFLIRLNGANTSTYSSYPIYLDDVSVDYVYPTPNNLVAVATDEIVNLEWDAPSDTKGRVLLDYTIYRKIGENPFDSLNTVTETYYTDTSVENLISYTYAVRANYTNGQSQNSNEAVAVPMKKTSIPYSNNFSSSDTVFFASGDWQRGTPADPDSAFSDTTCWATNLEGDYTADVNSRLFKAFDLSYLEDGAKVTFYYHLDEGDYSTNTYLIADPENDGTFANIETLDEASEWTQIEIIIPPEQCSEYTKLGFALEAGSVVAPGLYIDNFEIEKYNPAEFDVQPPAVYADMDTSETLTKQITVSNPGGEDVVYSAALSNVESPNIILEESFDETDSIPAGWINYEAGDPAGWSNTTQQSHSPTNSAFHNDDNVTSGCNDWLITPVLDLSGLTSPQLIYWDYVNDVSYADSHNVMYSTDYSGSGDPNTATWNNINTTIGTEDTWVDNGPYTLPSNATVYIAFQYTGDWAAEWYIDDIKVQETPTWITINDTTTIAPDTLAGGMNTNIDVDLMSGSTPGTYTADVVFTHNADLDPTYPTVTVPVTMTVGDIIGAPVAVVEPTALADTVLAGETSTQTFTIDNAGDEASILSYTISHNYTTGRNPDSGNNRQSGHSIYSEVLRPGASRNNRIEDWLSITPVSGTCPYNEPDEIEVTFDGNNIFAGNYTAEILIAHNGDDSPTIIPVNFNVNASAGHPPLGTISFDSYITARPGEVLTQDSVDCSYGEAWTGFINVDVTEFATPWEDGDTLKISAIEDSTGFTSEVSIVLEHNPQSHQIAGKSFLAPAIPEITSAVANGSKVELDWEAQIDSIMPAHYLVFKDGAVIDTVFNSLYTEIEVPDGIYDYSIKNVFKDVYGSTTVKSSKSEAVEVTVNAVREQPNSFGVAVNSAYTTWEEPDYAPVTDTLQSYKIYLLGEVPADGDKTSGRIVRDTLQADTLDVSCLDYQFNQSTMDLLETYTAGIIACYLSGSSDRLDSTFVYEGPPASENFAVDAEHAYITWDEPAGTTNDTLSYFKVYLDGDAKDTLTVDVTDFQFDQYELSIGTDYTAGIKAGYITMNDNVIETELQDSVFTYAGPSSPEEFQVNERAFAVWDEPVDTPTDELAYYKLYLDEVEKDSIGINDLRYQFEQTELVESTTYTAGIKAGYETIYGDYIESEPATYDFEFIKPPHTPPLNLAADAENTNEVLLSWNAPPQAIIQYQNGYAGNGVGNDGHIEFTCATKFKEDSLTFYYGKQLTNVNMVIRSSDDTPDYNQVVLKVWEKSPTDSVATEIRSTDITSSVVEDQWTYHTLEVPVTLIEGNEYWLGYFIEAIDGHPAAVDNGPMVENGAWVNFGDGWGQLTSFNPTLDYNWCIQGFVNASPEILETEFNTPHILAKTPSSYNNNSAAKLTDAGIGYKKNISNESVIRYKKNTSNELRTDNSALRGRGGIIHPTGYNVYRDSSLISPVIPREQVTYLDDEGLSFGTYEYFIIAVYGSEESDACRPVSIDIYELDAPTNLEIEETSGTATWSAPDNENLVGYNVYLDDMLVGAEITDTSYTYENLEYDSTYVSKVEAVYGNGGELATELEFTYVPVFNPPLDLTAVVGNDNDVLLDWDAPVSSEFELIGYNAYRNESQINIIIIPDTVTTYVDTNLTNGTYEYYVTAVYELGGESNPSNTAEVTISPSQVTQDIDLLEGWNIVSFNVIPDSMDMMNIVQPLIDSEVLVKVQDEAGSIIIELPSGWVNNIGDMMNSEGYYVKVDSAATLSVTGIPVELPYDISLVTGWNMMSYPANAPQNALDAVQPLIDGGVLVKVQDETGSAIQELPTGWFNGIGDFEPGEGYYTKVNADTSIQITESVVLTASKNTTNNKIVNLRENDHFETVYQGNGYNHMTLLVISQSLEDLNNNDEVAVFDNDRCVGMYKVNSEIPDIIQLTASADDPITAQVDGFINGNEIEFRIWDADENSEIQVEEVNYLMGTNVFGELTTAQVALTAPLGMDVTPEVTVINNNYPNPFSNHTNINFALKKDMDVNISVYNIRGQKVKTLVDENMKADEYSINWNGKDDSGNTVSNGVYFYRMKTENYTNMKKMIFMK